MNSLLSSVNTTLNNSIGYRASPDRWEAADIGGTGDCKGIALGKQIRLEAAGFATGLCTVATPSGEGHCVLSGRGQMMGRLRHIHRAKIPRYGD